MGTLNIKLIHVLLQKWFLIPASLTCARGYRTLAKYISESNF